MQWTEGQQIARDEILAHIESGPGIYVLAGYAGTGKTTVVTDVLSQANVEPETCYKCGGTGCHSSGGTCFGCGGSGLDSHPIVLCAPTHKAVSVLAEKNTLKLATVATLHSVLAARPVWEKSERQFLPSWDKARWREHQIIVIDEVSMLGENEWSWVLDAQERWPRVVICMGDPAQLPPVGHTSSPAWESIDHELCEVVRHDGEVLAAATQIRQNLIAAEKGMTHVLAGERILRPGRDAWLEAAIAAFEAGENAKMLAWRNSAVDYLNARVRQHFYPGASDMPQPGETRVVIETWGDGLDMRHAESTIRVKHAVEAEFFQGVTGWNLELEGGGVVPELEPGSKKAFSRVVADCKKKCIAGQRHWREYYELVSKFIRTRPSYATTIHKSQGSTYDGVWLAESDLRACAQEPHLRNRLHYVGVSRASGDLWII